MAPHRHLDFFQQVEDAFCNALLSDRKDKMEVFMTDDWVRVHAGGILTRPQFFEDLGRGRIRFDHLQCKIVRVRVHGNVAVATGKATWKGHFQGADVDVTEWTTNIYVSRDGRWVCSLSQSAA